MDAKWLILYFLLGGAIVTLVTYFGGQGKGLLAAFVAFFPSITVLTMFTIYFNGGLNATISYFKSMLLLLPAWLLYVIPVLFLLPKLGPVPSVLIGIAAYVGAAFVTIRLAS
jgi:uncharacterized membrane protein (GlpM family)